MRNRLSCLIVVIGLGASVAPAWAQEELTITKIYSPAATDLTLAPTSDVVLNPTGKDVLPGLGYDVNLGMLTKKYLTLHAAELWVETLVAQNTMATIGGRILVAPTTALTVDLSTGATSITVKHNNLANGDRVYLEANGSVEFMAITSAASGSGPYTYSVTRNLDGSGANAWTAGDAVLNTGQAGNGFIDLYSVRGVRAGTEIGPTIVFNQRLSGTYNDWAPRTAIGNLDGLYGYTGSTYGAAFGVPSGARVTVDTTNGIRIYGGDNDQKVTIDTAGNATFDGNLTVGVGVNQVRNSECNVASDDWIVGTNSGLTIGGGRTATGVSTTWALRAVGGCYLNITGTPANGTVSDALNTQTVAVAAGQRYEASAYMGLHRTAGIVFITWLNSAGGLISTSSSTTCAAAATTNPGDPNAGGFDLIDWCRAGVIATAPANATQATITVRAAHNGTGLDPFLFYVRAYFGEAGIVQEDLTAWTPPGITSINNGLIDTDAINARTIAADSITSAKIAAGTIVASDIATGTITADRMNVSSLSAITGNMGTLTAGSITGGTIDGATIRAGTGDEVTLDSSGITISGGTGTNNRIKWTGGHEMWGTTGGIFVNGSFSVEDVLVVGGEGTSAIDLSVTDLGVGDQIQFVNMPSSTGTAVIWESSCGCLKKQTSSARYKENVRPWHPTDAQRLLNATPITFDYRPDRDGRAARNVLGLSAEDLYRLAPGTVNVDAAGQPDSIDQSGLNAYLLQIVKELRAEIDALRIEVRK